MAQQYIRTYIHIHANDSWRVGTNYTIFFDPEQRYKFVLYSDESNLPIKKLVKIRVRVPIKNEDDRARKLSWDGTFVVNGTNLPTKRFVNTEETSKNAWGEVVGEWNSQEVTLEDFNALTALISRPNNGRGTHLGERPMYLDVVYEASEYEPHIDEFYMSRCTQDGTLDPEGDYAKAFYQLSTIKEDETDASDVDYSITIKDAQNHTILSLIGLDDVSAVVNTGEVHSTVGSIIYDKSDEFVFLLEFKYHSEVISGSARLFGASTNISISTFPVGGVALGGYCPVTEDDTEGRFDCFYRVYFALNKIPTFDPHEAGRVWRDGDNLKISLG